jgi:hypothetical protein
MLPITILTLKYTTRVLFDFIYFSIIDSGKLTTIQRYASQERLIKLLFTTLRQSLTSYYTNLYKEKNFV